VTTSARATSTPTTADTRGLAVFLAVAFGVSWTLGGVRYLVDTTGHALPGIALTTAFMFGPAIGAWVAQRRRGEALWRPLGVVLKPNRAWWLAWLWPLLFAGLAAVASLCVPGVTGELSLAPLLDKLASMNLPADKLEEARTKLAAFPPVLFVVVQTLQALVAGASINLVAALGEELGWRGFMVRATSSLGFWRASFVIGVVWGLWHAPIILQGHNYPEHPVIGVALMTLFTTLLSPWLVFVRVRGKSVIAAALLHGTFNAVAGFGALFLRGGSDLTVGATGLAGCAVLVVLDVVLWRVARPQLSAEDVTPAA
jgi:membrane protease YdiL (CAAX protease family)